MSKRLFLLALLALFLVVSTGCSNQLADENEKIRKQVLELQREIVALKTDKKILQEKNSKLTSLVPPDLLPVEELVTKLPAERKLGKIPARSDIIRYVEQNIVSLAQGVLGAGDASWRVTKFTFIPPDLVYVDYESGAKQEKVLLLYSLLEESGIKTELKAYFRAGNSGKLELIKGEDVDHIATPLVYTFSENAGSWEEITKIGNTPPAEPISRIEIKPSKIAAAEETTNSTPPELAVVETSIEANPEPTASANLEENVPSGSANTISADFSKKATYSNKWHEYTIQYPSYWYFWGIGQTETALFRTAFALTEVTTNNALITIDVVAKTTEELRAMYPNAQATSYLIDNVRGWHLVLPNGTEIYLRALPDNKSIVFTSVASQAMVLKEMIATFSFNG
ncbi:MAG: hypothetical protein A2788_01465 [Candidatus Abawacabacteria bacterium RIFCSPHIGHO2_01_FULL_46_8]|uniref:Uncharacterized protein n=1 Tax=Candidatus Abawacabacteria bacterium RIFCSPHIGHO2_01_FULL_46_8 TaxID=1817815 RepID=A0A1F4XP71_9BACT|nr:MAG: hypothetical protein A2788_01465 [Candidatus Abawacabacteria bacterium RIFCSPHIGHO2_01_FULL_46_8]